MRCCAPVWALSRARAREDSRWCVAREHSLWQRIATSRDEHTGGFASERTGEDPEALMESIRHHLTRLLNSRHGMCETLPDYGLPALSDLFATQEGGIQRAEQAVRNTIEKYEPRLRNVQVRRAEAEEGRQRLVFRIDAVMVGKAGRHRVWYETSFNAQGEANVFG